MSHPQFDSLTDQVYIKEAKGHDKRRVDSNEFEHVASVERFSA